MEKRPSLPARFFKIILPSAIALPKMRIPNKFAAKYGHELRDVVKIKDPIGGIWCVRLERTEKSVWMHHGWEKFSAHYSISFGYFLLFSYIGNSDFVVHIFDLTATEIHYPLAELDCGIKSGKMDTAGTSKFMHCYQRRSKVKIVDGDGNQSSFPMKSQLANRGKQVEEKYLPENPSFRVVFESYNLHPKFVLHVPLAFSEHLTSSTTDAELYDSDGNMWPVRVTNPEHKARDFGKGWRKFAREKNLKVGDTCVFELVDKNKPKAKVKVLIHRGQTLQL